MANRIQSGDFCIILSAVLRTGQDYPEAVASIFFKGQPICVAEANTSSSAIHDALANLDAQIAALKEAAGEAHDAE